MTAFHVTVEDHTATCTCGWTARMQTPAHATLVGETHLWGHKRDAAELGVPLGVQRDRVDLLAALRDELPLVVDNAIRLSSEASGVRGLSATGAELYDPQKPGRGRYRVRVEVTVQKLEVIE